MIFTTLPHGRKTLADLTAQLKAWVQISICALMIIVPGASNAFTDLTPAQALIYDSSHLASTKAGQTLTYSYAHASMESEPLSETVTLSITKEHENDKRDVTLDFLSGENRIPFPDFKKFRGNPVLVATLEHFAQSIGRETGGGVLYFRNRIRDALAEDTIEVSEKEVNWNGKPVQSKQMTIKPFINDPYLAEQPDYKFANLTITLSDQVPGSVVGISMESRVDGEVKLSRTLALETPEK